MAQVSGYISEETKANMEHYSSSYGIKKGFLIETALNHYLQVLKEIPEEFIVSTQIILSHDSFKEVASMLENPPEPTDALKELMRGD
ncbi:MAG: hypothetical protein KU38_04420 [Sulfurovum sp. FS08-3]|nr:MAG: hypothetical protein KU38_04420 [Sulfurovum sp. FS08-3]